MALRSDIRIHTLSILIEYNTGVANGWHWVQMSGDYPVVLQSKYIGREILLRKNFPRNNKDLMSSSTGIHMS